MDVRRNVKGDKVCRGAYDYFKRDTMYAEEEFEVYKDRKDLYTTFIANLYARIPTGELLTTYVDYVVTKDFMPHNLYIERTLGKNTIQENYSFDDKENRLNYHYSGPKAKKHVQIATPSKFSLTTPTTSTSFTFLKSKKEDPLAKNYYNVVGADNNWSFEKGPDTKVVVMERLGIGSESISIDGKQLQSVPYKLFDSEDLEDGEEAANTAPFLNVFMSSIVTIPYQIKSDDGTKIQVKYLNDFDN